MGGILRNGRFVLGALAVVCAAAAFVEAAETTFRGPHHYSLRVPAGWSRVDDATLKRASQLLASAAGIQSVSYDAAFEREGALEPLAFPYILVQYHEGSTSGVYRDIEKQMDQGIAEAKSKGLGKLSEVIGEIGFDKPVVDRARNRVLVTMRTQHAAFGAMRGFVAMHLGADGVAQVMLYALESDADRLQRDFAEISDSVRFESGYEFGASRIFSGWKGKALIGGIIGAVVGLLRGLLRKKTGSVRASTPAPGSSYGTPRPQVEVPPWERAPSPTPAPAPQGMPRTKMDVPPWERAPSGPSPMATGVPRTPAASRGPSRPPV